MDINLSSEFNGGGDQTGFLLQRLQELKAWQQEQEDRLLKEQEDQIEQLYLETNEGTANVNYILRQNLLHKPEKPEIRYDDDDDTTDQDISSIVSFDAHIVSESKESSSNVVTAVSREVALPGWATVNNSHCPASLEPIGLGEVRSFQFKINLKYLTYFEASLLVFPRKCPSCNSSTYNVPSFLNFLLARRTMVGGHFQGQFSSQTYFNPSPKFYYVLFIYFLRQKRVESLSHITLRCIMQ